MKRYFREVEKFERGQLSLYEFYRKVIGEERITRSGMLAFYRIYKEDGGTRYDWLWFEAFIEEEDIPISARKQVTESYVEGVE